MSVFDAQALHSLREFLHPDRRECVEYDRHEVMVLPYARELPNCVGTLLLVRRSLSDTNAPDVVLMWIPYSLLAVVAPHCLSPRGQQVVKPFRGRTASPERNTPPEWAFTFILQLTQIERLRKSLSRGCRALSLSRAQGLPDITLMFCDGGSSALLVALKNFTTLTINPQNQDEYIVGRRSYEDQRHVDVLNGSAVKVSKPEKGSSSRLGVFEALLNWGGSSTRSSQPVEQSVVVVDAGLRSNVEQMLQPIVRSSRRMLPPVSQKEWNACFDVHGRIDADAFQRIRTRAFSGGFEPAVRPLAWAYLLGVYDMASTTEDRENLDAARAEQYAILTQQWQSIFPEQEKNFSAFRSYKHSIEKDVRRTDRVHEAFSVEGSERHLQMHRVLMAHLMFDMDLGYCQGMSDILAVILLLMDDEERTFTMFRTLLHRKMDGNFRDVNVSTQMDDVLILVRHFVPDLYLHLERIHALTSNLCFHWILLLFKREFGLRHIYPIWDVVLCCPFTVHYEVFITVALLKHLSPPIVEHRLTLDEILQLINAVGPGRYHPMDVIAITHDLYEHIANYTADIADTIQTDTNPRRHSTPPPKQTNPQAHSGASGGSGGGGGSHGGGGGGSHGGGGGGSGHGGGPHGPPSPPPKGPPPPPRVRTDLRDIVEALRVADLTRRPPSERTSPMTPRTFQGNGNPA